MNLNPILRACLETLKRALGPDVPVRLERTDAKDIFVLNIATRPSLRLSVEVKRRIATRSQALHLILQLRGRVHVNGGTMLFSQWIPGPVAEVLRTEGVFFADAQGNVFIRTPPRVVLDIRGLKPERSLKAEPGRLIDPAGLKVIHFLLTRPDAVHLSLRAMGEGAGVALGSVHAIMKELEREQWILPAHGGLPKLLGRGGRGACAKSRGRRFGDWKGLIELFVRGYTRKLRPACLIGSYRHRMRTPQMILDELGRRLADLKGHWAVTGAMAGRELTRYLEPDTVALFVDDRAMEELERAPLLRDDTDGNVTLVRLFGTAAIADRSRGAWPLATPLLIYAELLENGGGREIETARMVYERFLAGPPAPHEPKAGHGQ